MVEEAGDGAGTDRGPAEAGEGAVKERSALLLLLLIVVVDVVGRVGLSRPHSASAIRSSAVVTPLNCNIKWTNR